MRCGAYNVVLQLHLLCLNAGLSRGHIHKVHICKRVVVAIVLDGDGTAAGLDSAKLGEQLPQLV